MARTSRQHLLGRCTAPILMASLVLGLFHTLGWIAGKARWQEIDLSANIQSHASALGVLAAVVAAVVVIFLNRQDECEAQANSVRRYGAIGAFLCAFLVSMLGSFQYATMVEYHSIWWNSVGKGNMTPALELYPEYLYNLNGVSYLLSAYLCFYALALAARYYAPRPELSGLLGKMLLSIGILGGFWVFIDFVCTASGVFPIDTTPLGQVCAILVLATSIRHEYRRPARIDQYIRMLYRTLVGFLMLSLGLAIWYAAICYLDPSYVERSLPYWYTGSVYIVAIALAVLFTTSGYWLRWTMSDIDTELR